MIRCQKCGATNADGKASCSVCGTTLNHRYTAEIEGDVLAAIAALAPEQAAPAPPPPPPQGSVAQRLAAASDARPTVVRHEGPRTLFGRSASDRAGADEVPHPVLDGASGLPKTIIKDRGGLGRMFGAQHASADATSPGLDLDDGTFFGVGTAGADESGPEATAFGLGLDDSGLGNAPSAVPDWLSSTEDELRDSDEFDRFVGPGPSQSAMGRGDQSGAGTRLGAARRDAPDFELGEDDPASRTDPGVRGEAGAQGTAGSAAGVLRKRARAAGARGKSGATPARPARRDLRFEEDDSAGAERGVAFDNTFAAGSGATVASPASGAARPTVNDLGFADTGAFEGFQSDARQRIAARTGSGSGTGPQPRRSPATGSSSPRPARVESSAPDAAWDVFVPEERDGVVPPLSARVTGPVSGAPAAAVPPERPAAGASTALDSARRVVIAVAAVVVLVCLAFGAFLLWLVDA